MPWGNRISVFLLAPVLGACSSAWWHDPPATAAAGPSPAGVAMTPPTSDGVPPPVEMLPSGSIGDAGGGPAGASYPTPEPGRRAARRSSMQAASPVVDPARYPDPPVAPPVRYDNVGYAIWASEPGSIAAAHATLPPGSFAEVTVLDSGRTILVPITSVAHSGREIELSGAAAQALGLQGSGPAGVRVRAANPGPGDLVALRSGGPAPTRPDTPPVLLTALRHKLDGTLGQVTPDDGAGGPATAPTATRPTRAIATSPAPRPATTAPPASVRQPKLGAKPGPSRPAVVAPPAPSPRAGQPAVTAGGRYYVQIAALSDAARAQALARAAKATVVSGGGVYRVQVGPYGDARAAQAARDALARRGYGDARIVRPD